MAFIHREGVGLVQNPERKLCSVAGKPGLVLNCVVGYNWLYIFILFDYWHKPVGTSV